MALRSSAAILGVALAAAACTPAVPSGTPLSTAASTSAGPSASTPTTALPSPTVGPLSFDQLSITFEPFARIIASPLAMTAPNDGSGRIFVANQVGQIWVVERAGTVEKNLFVNLDDLVASGGERGLLGIAAHPDFPTDPRVFVDYTNNDGDTVVASLTLDPDDLTRLDATSLTQLLLIKQPYANHNGGSLQFGSDGYLTIAMGDGGSGGDPQGNGQNPDTLLAKILRIDVDADPSAGPYGIPPDNPYATGGGKPEIWLSGLRNPWRTSFDRSTGDLWIGDVGQGAWEEVDVLRTGVGGLNLGWNVMEGAHCYNASKCHQTGLTFPVAEYGHDLGCAIVGGYVYRGAAYPFLVGTYLFSDNCSGRVFAIDASSDGPSTPVQVGTVGASIASFGEDAAGELYALTLEGAVNRVVATLR